MANPRIQELTRQLMAANSVDDDRASVSICMEIWDEVGGILELSPVVQGKKLEGRVIDGIGLNFGGQVFFISKIETLPPARDPVTGRNFCEWTYQYGFLVNEPCEKWEMDDCDHRQYENHLHAIERTEEIVQERENHAITRSEELRQVAHERGYKRGWVWYRMRDEFGAQFASKILSKE